MTTWNIVKSELIEWLQAHNGPRFHAVLSDPPYALISITKRFGKDGSAPTHGGSDGRYTRLSSGFMGQKWDGFDSLEHYQTWVAEWAKLLIEKALHPGAVCLFFGGTRTFHHLGVGLERGGFEIVDCLMWLYGQGFPKSHDISKGLDKSAGAERASTDELLPGHSEARKRTFGTGGEIYGEAKEAKAYKTVPATPEAETWDGYGTALKPAWEPVFVCRAPRGDMTFAELAVEYGTGALNIDGARIDLKGDIWAGNEKNAHEDYSGQVFGKFESQYAKPSNPSGRWPANLMLTHHEACVKVGEYEVEGRVINRWKAGMLPFGGGKGKEYETIDPSREGEASAERTYEHEGGTDFKMKPGARRGMETVDLYACVPGCPVRELDDQAGELSSGLMKASTTRAPRPEHAVYSGVWKGNATDQDTYADVGGPSRFFYTAKASRSEKDKGLENFYWKRTDQGFERISLSEYEQLDKRERAQGCIHPTVKPLELLRYLSTLSLPPKQEGKIRRILIPFSGSGSEMIGAAQAGWDEITGIEMEQNYIEMAEARLTANIGMF